MDQNQAAARAAMDRALQLGAQQAAASISQAQRVEVEWRDGKMEKISQATTRSLGLQLYVDGRYASVSTSDLRPDALNRFVGESLELTRRLAPDPHRALPDPRWYAGQAKVDLQVMDDAVAGQTPQARKAWVQKAEAAARDSAGSKAINSVATRFGDTRSTMFRIHSNGFEGTRVESSVSVSATVSVTDPDGRRPMEGEWMSARHVDAMPAPENVGRAAVARALGRLGARKLGSSVTTLVVENRVAGQLVGRLLGPLSASALQQKRSFLDGKMGQKVGSALLDLVDDPHLPRGLGSRLFDDEGIAARPLPLFQGGVLAGYYVDNYYGRKLGLDPTTANPSNHQWKPGTKGQDALLRDVTSGILVTGFLGGNSNGTTGDFSLGIQGFSITNGAVGAPVAEMNIAGNHLELWKRLVAVGNDPFPGSNLRTPTLVLEGVQVAGV